MNKEVKYFLTTVDLISFLSQAITLARSTRAATDANQDVDKTISSFLI